MSLARLFISRHALAASLSIAIVLLGVFSYFRIGIDRHPDVEFPALSITTGLPGMSAQSMALAVTRPLEAKLNTIAGVKSLASSSVTGLSVITITFDSSTDSAEVLNEVQARISQARSELPAEAKPSVVQRFSLNATPVMWLALSGARTTAELNTLAKTIQKRLESVSGVGEVRLRGLMQSVLQVTVHDSRLSALNLTYGDIEHAFAMHHVNAGGGRMKTNGKEYQLDLDFEFSRPSQLQEMPISDKGGRIIRLGELASIEETFAHTREFAQYNSQGTIALGIVKASGENPVAVVSKIRKKVNDELATILPPGVALTVITDGARPVANIVKVLKSHLIEGTLLTALVVWLFVQNAWATSIIAITIPVSLLGAITALYFSGFTFNSFTLLALLLLIGVVVDDAIVVLENIYRTKERYPGLATHIAAEKGTSEVMFAVMAATLTLVCVFGPVVFLPGVLGQYLTSFSVTVIIGVLVSWFVSVSLTPMLCARYLTVNTVRGGVQGRIRQGFRVMESRYLKILSVCLNHPKLVLVAAALTLLPMWWLMGSLKTEFTPQANEGKIAIQLSLPSGHGKERITELARHAEAQLEGFSDIAGVLTTFEDGGQGGSDTLSLLVILKDAHERMQPNLISALQKKYASVPAWRATVQAASSLSSNANGAPLHFSLLGPDYKELQKLAYQMEQRLSRTPGLENLSHDLNSQVAQLKAMINMSEAARLGVTPYDMSRAISAFNGHLVVGRYNGKDGERHDILLRSHQGVAPASTTELGHIKIRTRSGELVPLSSVAQFMPQAAPASLKRLNQQYAVTFFGNPQLALGEAVALVGEMAKGLPPGYSVSFSGQSEEMRNARSNLAILFGLGLLFLYLVLASQFNSFIQPLLIMLAQPLALIGGIGALVLTGQTLNVYSTIGLLLLMGLVAKNAILLVDRANQLIHVRSSTREALLEACPDRLRAVAMTALTLVLALLPAACGLGAGAEYNQPLSIAVIGGMVTSTSLTLLVIPAAYLLLAGDKRPRFEPKYSLPDSLDLRISPSRRDEPITTTTT